MVNWKSQSKKPPQSLEDGLIYCTWIIRIAFCLSENLPLGCLFLRYYEHLFLFSMLKLHVTSSRFCLYLLNTYHFTYTFSHAHTEAHTHKHTCTICTQEEWRQPGTGAWLRGAEERLTTVRDLVHTHKKKWQKEPIFTNLKNRFEHIDLPAKLLDYFLRSNKRNINQSFVMTVAG